VNKAVFLDRDGTIIEDVGYLNNPAEIKFIPGSIEAIKMLNENGFKVVVITNQSGVARGLIAEDMLQTIDKIIQKKILNGHAHLDRIYYCPHHPEAGHYPYKQECGCRKPAPGMIQKAQKDLNIDLAKSFMIGDKISDIEAGQRVGMKNILVLSGRGQVEKERIKTSPDFIAQNLKQAAEWILNNQ